MIRQWKRRCAGGGHFPKPATYQDVVELAIGVVDREGEVPGERAVAGDLCWSAIRHVEVAHQDHRLLQRGEVPLDPPELEPPPARHVGQVSVGNHDRTRWGAQPSDHRSARLLFHDDHFPRSAQIQRHARRDSR